MKAATPSETSGLVRTLGFLALLLGGWARPVLAGETPRPTMAIVTTVTNNRGPAAGDVLTDLLTARLSADSRWQLVERDRLADLKRELVLSMGGWTEAASAVRQGRLNRADVVLVCRLREADDAHGTAELQAIDVLRAQRLANESIALAERPVGPWLRSPPAADAAAIGDAAVRLAVAAANRLDAIRGHAVVAPLFFHVTRPYPAMIALPDRLMDTLQQSSHKRGDVCLTIQAADAVQEEGLLYNAGLTDLSAETWQNVADLYVWGELSVVGKGAQPGGALSLQLQLSTWGGSGLPEVHLLSSPLSRFDEMAQRAAELVAQDLTRYGHPSPKTRRQAAATLMTAAHGPDQAFSTRASAADLANLKSAWRYVDAAAFFVPEDRRIQELRLMILRRFAKTDEARAQVATQYCQLARTFWQGASGELDLGLLSRAIAEDSPDETPAVELIREIGSALRSVSSEDLTAWAPLLERCEGIIARGFSPHESTGPEVDDNLARSAFEAIWPTLRTVLPEQNHQYPDHYVSGYYWTVRAIYRDDPNHADALLKEARAAALEARSGTPAGRWRVVASTAPSFDEPPMPSATRAQPASPPVAAKPVDSDPVDTEPQLTELRQATPEQRDARLIEACTQGQAAWVRQLLALGADPTHLFRNQANAVTETIHAGHWEILEMLLAAKPNLGRQLRPEQEPGLTVGQVALGQVLAQKRPDLAWHLLAAGARPTTTTALDGPRYSLVTVALKTGDLALTQKLIAMGDKPLSSEYPLHWAVETKNLPALQLLLDLIRQGKNQIHSTPPSFSPGIELEDRMANDGETALLRAVISGWEPGVEALVAAGATTDVSVPTGRSLWEYAAEFPGIAVLVNRQPGSAANQLGGAQAVAAILRDDPGVASWPIDAAVLHYRDFRGWTVLHYACRHTQVQFAERLVKAGAPLNVLNDEGTTPLEHAAARCNATVVALMIQAGAKVNLVAGTGPAPLHGAASHGNPETIRVLLKAGADLNQRGFASREVPLLTAVKRPTARAALPVFLQAGASLAAVDGFGYGALEYAVMSDDPAALQQLLDLGVRWQRPWPADYHPLLYAAKLGAVHSVQKLLELGLRDSRALSATNDRTIRALLEDDARGHGAKMLDDAQLWPAICSDAPHGVERAAAHLARGGEINYRDQTWTPLILAARAQNVPLVKYLVEHGADPDLRPTARSTYALSEMIPNSVTAAPVSANVDSACAAMVPLLLKQGSVWPCDDVLVEMAVRKMPESINAMLAQGVSTAGVTEAIPPRFSPEYRAELLRRLHVGEK